MKVQKNYRIDENTVKALETMSEQQNVSMATVIERLVNFRAFRDFPISLLDEIYGQEYVNQFLEVKKIEEFKREVSA